MLSTAPRSQRVPISRSIQSMDGATKECARDGRKTWESFVFPCEAAE
jgi:hypothetical protein